ncbi:MAG: hypothetical protein R3D29_08970 [Nitratireductor sp.]
MQLCLRSAGWRFPEGVLVYHLAGAHAELRNTVMGLARSADDWYDIIDWL